MKEKINRTSVFRNAKIQIANDFSKINKNGIAEIEYKGEKVLVKVEVGTNGYDVLVTDILHD